MRDYRDIVTELWETVPNQYYNELAKLGELEAELLKLQIYEVFGVFVGSTDEIEDQIDIQREIVYQAEEAINILEGSSFEEIMEAYFSGSFDLNTE